MGSEARSSLTRAASEISQREMFGLISSRNITLLRRERDFHSELALRAQFLEQLSWLCTCAPISRVLSRSAAVDPQRRRSDRSRELAELRWCDRILAVRQANREANPTDVHPGKLPQH